MYELHLKTAQGSDPDSTPDTVLEFARLEDAIHEAFLQLDAGRAVSTISGSGIEITAAQIRRNWRAARQ